MSALIVSRSHRRQPAVICWLQRASSRYRAFSLTSGVTNGPGIGFRPIRQQSNQRGALQMHGTNTPASVRTHSRSISIRIARDPNDLMLVTAIRAAVYLAEQDCPIEE